MTKKPFDDALALARGYANGGRVGYWDGGDTSRPAAKMAREIQQRAMAGLDPTPEQAAFLRSVMPEKEERSSALGNLPGTLLGALPYSDWKAGREAEQKERAGMSLGERTGARAMDYLSEASGPALMATPYSPAGTLEGLMLRGLGHGAKTVAGNPLAQKGVLGGLGATALPSTAGSGEPSTLERMLAAQADTSAQLKAAMADLEAQRTGKSGGKIAVGTDGKPITAGQGPAYERAAKRVDALTEQSRQLSDQIKAEQTRAEKAAFDASPAGILAAEKAKKAFDEEQKQKAANTSVREMFADYMPAIPVAGAIAGGILGNRIKAANVTKYNAGLANIMSRWEPAVKAAKAGDVAAATEARKLGEQFAALKAAGPGGDLKALAAGAGAGEIATFLPEEIDLARAIPGSDLQKKVFQPYMDDPWLFPKRVGAGLITGAGPAELGSLWAGRKATAPMGLAPETLALSRRLSAQRSSTPIPSQSPLEGGPLREAPLSLRSEVPPPAPSEVVPKSSASKASSAPASHWAIEAPEGAPPLPKGYVWHQRANGIIQPRNETTNQWGEMPKYSAPRAKSAKPKDTAEKLPASKGNGAGTKEGFEEVAPGVPKKPDRMPGPDDPGNTSFRKGGFVSKALALARKFAGGGGVEDKPETMETLSAGAKPRTWLNDYGLPSMNPPIRETLEGLGAKPTADVLQQFLELAPNAMPFRGGIMSGRAAGLKPQDFNMATKMDRPGYPEQSVMPPEVNSHYLSHYASARAALHDPFFDNVPYGASLEAANSPTFGVIQGGKKANGGGVGGDKIAIGAVMGNTDGRGDAKNVSVPAGAFVIPSDVVAALGGHNTGAGAAKLTQMFKPNTKALANGGSAGTIPIRISDGEFVVTPDHVAALGNGDMDAGHRILDQFVIKAREESIKKLKSLPGPSRD